MTLLFGTRVAMARPFPVFARYSSGWLARATSALFEDPELARAGAREGMEVAEVRWHRWAARRFPEARALVHAVRWIRRHHGQRPLVPTSAFLAGCLRLHPVEVSRALGRPLPWIRFSVWRHRRLLPTARRRWDEALSRPLGVPDPEGEIRRRLAYEAALLVTAVAVNLVVLLAVALVVGGGRLP